MGTFLYARGPNVAELASIVAGLVARIKLESAQIWNSR